MTTATSSPSPTPDQALAALGIKSRSPVALEHALEWAAVLAKIQEGQSARDACYLARVSHTRWRRWMKLGSRGRPEWGCAEHGARSPTADCAACVKRRDTPVAPFNELVAAARWYGARWRGRIYKNMVERAEGGDQRAAEYVLARADGAKFGALRAETERLKQQLLRAQVRQANAEAELAEKKVRGEHIERHEVIDPEDPRWKALQIEVFGHERQGIGGAPMPLLTPSG